MSVIGDCPSALLIAKITPRNPSLATNDDVIIIDILPKTLSYINHRIFLAQIRIYKCSIGCNKVVPCDLARSFRTFSWTDRKSKAGQSLCCLGATKLLKRKPQSRGKFTVSHYLAGDPG